MNLNVRCVLGCAALLAVFSTSSAIAGELVVEKVKADLTKGAMSEELWKSAKEESVVLIAQPMAVPKPKLTNTNAVQVKAIHDGKWIAFKLRWADSELSEGGPLGQFSDAVAIQFPAKDIGTPPPVFMGVKGDPVHIYHWRAQYLRDKDKGVKTVRDIYPNMTADMYPLEFADHGNIKSISDEQREAFSHGRAAGNPQSYPKKQGIDELFAEGFGTSAVLDQVNALAEGEWKKGEWSVIVVRPLKTEYGSSLIPGKNSFIGFAVWQGGKDEVGSRKSVTMAWTPLQVKAQ